MVGDTPGEGVTGTQGLGEGLGVAPGEGDVVGEAEGGGGGEAVGHGAGGRGPAETWMGTGLDWGACEPGAGGRPTTGPPGSVGDCALVVTRHPASCQSPT